MSDTMFTAAALDAARQFIEATARPLVVARYGFHFQGGSRDAVRGALGCCGCRPKDLPGPSYRACRFLKDVDLSDLPPRQAGERAAGSLLGRQAQRLA